MRQTGDQWFQKALSGVEREAAPSEAQKEKMLSHVLCTALPGKPDWRGRFVNLIVEYPWRFAFGASAIQAVLSTLIWGTKYTNLLFGFMIGG